MPLPSSGTITISQIRDEAVNGGCYKVDATYSLSNLADAFEISTNPDAMSEFYGLYCPTQVGIYANYYADPTNETTSAYGLYYSINSGNDVLLTTGDNITTTCNSMGLITGLVSGDTIYVGWTSVSGKLRLPYHFDAQKQTTTCPNTNNFDYCGTNNVGGPAVSIANLGAGSYTIAITISVAKGFFVGC